MSDYASGDEFTAIEAGLRAREVHCCREGPERLVVSRQPWTGALASGNSFWVSRPDGGWFVCTWAGRYYRVPDSASVLDVAEAFAAVGTSAQARVPAALVARFGLAEENPDYFEWVWDAAVYREGYMRELRRAGPAPIPPAGPARRPV